MMCRAWDVVEDKWIDGFAVSQDGGLIIVQMGDSIILNHNAIVEYFTGRLDRNGKDICEGDRVKSHLNCETCEIRFGEYCEGKDDYGNPTWGVGFYWWNNGVVCGFGRDIHGFTTNYEVVGNIHEGDA